MSNQIAEVLFELSPKDANRQNGRWRTMANISLERPVILDLLEYDGKEVRRPSNLKYFRQPERVEYPIDLNEGYENYKFRNEDYYKTSLDKIEYYIMHNNLETTADESLTKIYANRAALGNIMQIPFKLKPNAIYNDVVCHAIKFNNVIYLASAKKDDNRTKDPKASYHFKLQQHCFSDAPHKKPNTEKGIDENLQQYCIYRSRLQNFELFYSAEINGVTCENKVQDLTNMYELNKCDFVLTKLYPKFQFWQNHPKTCGLWSQAYLVNVDQIFVALKDNEGIVRSAASLIKTEDLAKQQPWKPDVCIRYLYEFLAVIKKKNGRC